MIHADELKKYFAPKKLLRDVELCCVFLCIGVVLLMAFLYGASFADRGGSLYFYLQNAGVFFLFLFLSMTYAGIHRGNIDLEDRTLRPALLFTLSRAHIIAGLIAGVLVAVLLVACAELLVSLVGYIPYAGPVIVALLSLPLFFINLVVVTAVVLLLIVAPPMIGEGVPLKKMAADIPSLLLKRWVIILGYGFVSLLSILVLFAPVLMLARISVGINRSVQWSISKIYSTEIFGAIIRNSYVTDIVGKIAPRPTEIQALNEYGQGMISYSTILLIILIIMYTIAMAVIVSFFVSILFNVLSFLYFRIKKDIID